MRRNPVAGQGNRRVKVIVEADGGSRGNPGPAGYGTVVWSADRGAVLAESKQAIGRATNNVAEYRGLIAGLEEAAKLGATDVDVSMDSKLVVEQMSGRWKVKHPDLGVLHQQATALSTRFDHITYTWISRDKNSHADRLANEAMDAAAEIEMPAEKPTESAPSSPAGWTGARGATTGIGWGRHGLRSSLRGTTASILSVSLRGSRFRLRRPSPRWPAGRRGCSCRARSTCR